MNEGDQFGALVVIALLPRSRAQVQCTCGATRVVRRDNLRTGHTQSCGCAKRQAPCAVGDRFGRLVVVGLQHVTTPRCEWRASARCDCGQFWEGRASLLGRTVQSCGCYRSERMADLNRTHGGTHEPLFNTWRSMRERCAMPAHPRYALRGIQVCTEWDDYTVFRAYIEANLGPRSRGASLDRIDNDRGYEPGNVRWARPKQQTRNREITRRITVDGERLALHEWSERHGVPAATIAIRLARGWAPEDAVTRPVGEYHHKPGRHEGDTTNLGRSARLFFTLDGETQPVAVWAARTGIPVPTLYRRKYNGWSDEKALTTPTGRAVKRSSTP